MDLGTDSGGIDYSLPDISDADRMSLENSIQARLKELYGPGYSDVSLSKYIVVMLTNKTGRPVIEQSLAEFLDQNTAANFCSWLFSNLRSLLHRNSALTTENTSYPQPSRHIRSAVNLPNSDRNSRPAKDWYGNDEGDEKKPEAVFRVEEQPMGDLTMRLPMEHPHVDNNRRNNHLNDKDFRLPQSVRKKIIAKVGSRTKNKKAFQKEMRKEKRRLLNQQRYPRGSNRLVVTINGRPVDSIEADHPQVERAHNEKANSHNPNNAAFYAATPKAECAVLVKGLPPAVTNSNIRAHFAAKCGPIPRISILKRPISGESSNLAWVSLRSDKATRDALSLNGSTMMRHTIHVWRKESEEAKREVHAMNKESMEMYAPPDPYSMFGFGWGEDYPAEEEDWRSRFKYVRPQNGGGGGGGDGAAPVAMEVQRGPVVKEEEL